VLVFKVALKVLAMHAMSRLFMENCSGWGVLLIDVSNVFNSLNRIAALLIVRKYWPHCVRFVFNTYRGWCLVGLVLRSHSVFLFRKEGITTQGDPL